MCESDVLTDLARTIQWFGCPQPFDRAGYLRASAEQVPNPRSRVTLSDDVDSFGLRRVALDWQLSKIDKDTLRKSIFHIAEFFAMQNIGRVKVDPWLLNEELTFPPKAADELAGYHHMGTTRMGRGPDEGVVDTNCKVFGIDNLYVAGSSVFPTGGHANPTLTIVQLAARLADHIAAA